MPFWTSQITVFKGKQLQNLPKIGQIWGNPENPQISESEASLKGEGPIPRYKLHGETRWLTHVPVLKMLVLRAQKELSAEILSEWS